MALWTPAAISSAVAGWVDAADAATITSASSKISAITNKGSEGGSYTQATSGAQPYYGNTLGGLPVIGGGVGASMPGGPSSIAYVAIAEVSSGSSLGITMSNAAKVTEPGPHPTGTLLLGSNWTSSAYQFRKNGSDASSGSWSPPTGGALFVVERAPGTNPAGSNNPNSRIIDNGVLLNRPALDRASYIDIAEFLIFNRTLTSDEINQVEGYLAWKWDGGTAGTLVGQLPSGHAYKSAAPTISGGGPSALVAAMGSFSLTGQTASPKISRRIPIVVGNFALNGQSALFRKSRTLVGGLGSFSLNGQATSFIKYINNFWNTSNKGSGVSIGSGNNVATFGTDENWQSAIGASALTGVGTYDMILAGDSSKFYDVGIGNASTNINSYAGNTTNSIGVNAEGNLYYNAASIGGGYPAAVGGVTITVNYDIPGDRFRISNNGGSSYSAWISLSGVTGAKYPVVSAYYAGSNVRARMVAHSNITLSVTNGSFTLSGQNALLKTGKLLTASYGTMTITGQSARLLKSIRLISNQGSFTLSGQSTDLKISKRFVAAQGSFVLSGQAAVFKNSKRLSVTFGSFLLNKASISYRYYRWKINATRTVTGAVQASELRFLNSGSPVSSTPTVTSPNSWVFGEGPDKLANSSISDKWCAAFVGPNILVFDFGSAVTTSAYEWATANDAPERDPRDWTIEGSNDNSTWTLLSTVSGATITTSRNTWVSTQWPLVVPKTLSGDTGHFVLSGQTVSLSKSRSFVASYGNFALTGQAIGLQIVVPTPDVIRNDPFGYNMMGAMDEDKGNTLEVSYGNFTITGQSASLVSQRKLIIVPGNYLLTGQVTAFKRNLKLTASNGNFVIAGQQAKLNPKMKADFGTFILTGIAAVLFKSKIFPAGLGSFTLTGQNVGLRRNLFLRAFVGLFTLTGRAASVLRGTRYIKPDTGYYTIQGQNAQLGLPVPFASVQSSRHIVTSSSNVGRQLIAIVESSSHIISPNAPQIIGTGVDVPHIMAHLDYRVCKKERIYSVPHKERDYDVPHKDREHKVRGF